MVNFASMSEALDYIRSQTGAGPVALQVTMDSYGYAVYSPDAITIPATPSLPCTLTAYTGKGGVLSLPVTWSASTAIGELPTLPGSWDALVTNAAEYLAAIAAAPASGTPYYIAVQDGATIDLGSTNMSTGGFTDYTVRHSKDIVVAPQSWYQGIFQYMSDPFGDGNVYTRMVVRPCTIVGWHELSSGDAKIYGMKRTINLYPTAPTSSTYQKWEDIGVNPLDYLDTYYGTKSPDFSWNEYYVGKDINHTPFDISTKEYDMRSPDAWCYTGSSLITRARQFKANYVSGSNVMDVTSITRGAMPLAVGQIIEYWDATANAGAGGSVVTTIASLGTGTGDLGTYNLTDPSPVNLTGGNTSASATGNNSRPVDTDFVLDGWGDNADYPQYNRFAFMPSAIKIEKDTSNTFTGPSVKCTYNYIHDCLDGIRGRSSRNGTLDVYYTDNYITRMYHDCTRWNWSSKNAKGVLHWLRNIITNPVGHNNDGQQPHSDTWQAHGSNSGTTTGSPMAHWRSIGNLCAVDQNCRGMFQNHYLQMTYDYYTMGMEIVNNIGLSVNKFIAVLAQRSTWVRNCIGVTQDVAHPNVSVVASVYSNRDPVSTSVPDSVMQVDDTICEGFPLSSGNDRITLQQLRVKSLPPWFIGRDTTATFTNLNRLTPTVNDMFLAASELSVSSPTTGLTVSTLADMMQLTEASSHIIAAHFIPVAGVTPSATVTLAPAYIHGVPGTVVSVVPDAGVEWQTTDPYTGAVVQAFTTSTANAQCGQLISFRGAASASYLTETALGGTIGGVACRGRVITVSNTFFPTADNQVTAYSRIAKPTDARTFKGFIVALIGLKVDTWTNGAIVMADKNTNGYAKVALSTLGPGRFVTQWLGNTSTEGGSIANFDVSTDTTNRHTYIFAGDFTQLDSNQVIRCVKDYTLQVHSGTETINANGTETFSIGDFFGASGIGLFDVYAGTSTNLDGSIQGLWIELYEDPATMPDITNVDVINALTRDKLDINGDGSVTGVLARPMVYVQGPVGASDGSTANSWNATAGITNLGYGGGAMTKQTGTYA